MVHRKFTIVETDEQPMDVDECGCCSEKVKTPENKPCRNLNIVETDSQEEIPVVTPAKPKKRDYVVVSTEEQVASPQNVIKIEKPKTVREQFKALYTNEPNEAAKNDYVLACADRENVRCDTA